MSGLKFLTVVIAFCFLVMNGSLKAAEKPSVYQLKIYHYTTDEQEKKIDNFLQQAFLPALHKAGIATVGVFKPIVSMDTVAKNDRLIYVFIPFHSYSDFDKLSEKLNKDQQYLSKGKEYLDALYTEPPYNRIETILMKAFEKSPGVHLPKLTVPKKDRVYELRSYEGHTEKISKNKIDMFNKGDEISIFNKLGFNPVFYAEVISGPRMPNLIYLTTFESQASRDAHWDAFGNDENWKKLLAMPEYKNNMSGRETWFLYPTDYSDI